MGQPGNGVVAEAVVTALATPEPLVREMAAWALFRLDQTPFYELLEDHSEVARKMLQVLARRLRRTRASARPGRAPVDNLLGELQEKLGRYKEELG